MSKDQVKMNLSVSQGDLAECEAKLQEWRTYLQADKSWFDEYVSPFLCTNYFMDGNEAA